MGNSLPPIVDQVLNRYSRRIDGETAAAEATLSGFSGAGVWKINTGNETWALRRWPSRGLSLARLRGLHRLLEHIQSRGVNCIAVPIPVDSGETLVEHAGSVWQVEPWLPGTADFHAHPAEPRLKSAMNALARWHLAAASFVPATESREWFAARPHAVSPAVQERLTALRRISSSGMDDMRRAIRKLPRSEQGALCAEFIGLLPNVRAMMLAELSACEAKEYALQPCLRDIWHDHVLFTGDDVTGLIDASACRTENVATDLARLLGSLVEDDRPRWELALEAYQQHRRLSADEEILVRTLDRTGVWLSVWTWLQWLCVERRPFRDPDAVVPPAAASALAAAGDELTHACDAVANLLG